MTSEQMRTLLKDVSPKSRLVAFILAFIFGMFGIHRFYVGKTGTGLIMLLLTITLVFWRVAGLWVLFDCVLILIGGFNDSKGRVVKDWLD